jgi:hypothetical protein
MVRAVRTFTLIVGLVAGALLGAPAAADPLAANGAAANDNPATAEAVIWSFPGPYGEQLREAVLAHRGPALAGHRIAAAEVTEHLVAQRPDANALACLTDAANCADEPHAIMRALGVRARVTAEAKQVSAGWEVQLRQRRLGAATDTMLSGSGADLEAATVAALGEFSGQGRVQVTVKPADATLLLDGRPWATGEGTHPAPPGTWKLTVKAPNHAPMEVDITVVRGELSTVNAELVTSQSMLALDIDPPDALVLIDGEVVDPSRPIRLPPGKHTLEATADGKAPTRHNFVVEPSTRLDLSLKMREASDDWETAFSAPHPDTLAKPFQVRASLRFSSLGSGDLKATAGADENRVAVRRQTESMSQFGVSVSAGWRDEHLAFDALGLLLSNGGGPAKARMDDGTTGQIEDYRRFALRPLWFGLRLPRWRVDPYVQMGPVLAFDAFDAVNENGARQSFTRTAFLAGINMGARFFFSDQWFAHLGYDATFWFGERTASTFVLGGGWAFNFEMPKWL